MSVDQQDKRLVGRREFLKWAGVGTMATVLAACAPTPTATPEPVEPADEPEDTGEEVPAAEVVTIRVSAWGDVPDKNINDRTAAALKEVYPNIEMVPETYVGGYYEKVKVNFAGGESADLVYAEGFQWAPFADVVLALDDFIAADDVAWAWPDVMNYDNLTTWRGSRYLSVVDTGSMPMFYNKKIFDMAGLDYPTADWTYSDFKELVPKLTFEEDGVQYYGFDLTGGAWLGSYVWWVPWLRMDGAFEFDTLLEPKEAKWTQTEIIEAMQFVCYDTIAEGYAPSPSTVQGGGVSLATDRVAMGIQGPWYLPQLQGPDAISDDGVDFDVVMPPKGSAGSFPDNEIQGHMIAAESEHQEEAWQAMKFWLGEEVAEITAEEGRMCGTPENTEKYWVPIATEKFKFENADAFVEAQSIGQSPMIGGAGANFTVLMGAGGPLAAAKDAMYGLQKTAQEALEEANPLIQKLLDDYWAEQG